MSDNKNQNFIEGTKKNQIERLKLEAELKRKKAELDKLQKNVNKVSGNIEDVKCENQLLRAEIEFTKARNCKVDIEISQTKSEIEDLVAETLDQESKRKQCEITNKVFEKSTVSMRKQMRQLQEKTGQYQC